MRLAELQAAGTMRRGMESWEADGRRQVAGAEFIDLDNIIV
jgi:hypothetical protein